MTCGGISTTLTPYAKLLTVSSRSEIYGHRRQHVYFPVVTITTVIGQGT